MLDVSFITVKLEEGSKDLWSSVGVNLEEIDLNVFVLFAVVKISSQLFSEIVHITKIDQWSRVWKLGFFQEVFNFLSVVV